MIIKQTKIGETIYTIQKQKQARRLCEGSFNIPNPVNILSKKDDNQKFHNHFWFILKFSVSLLYIILSAEITSQILEFKTLHVFLVKT